MYKKIRHIFCSISTKVIFLIIVLVLPLNLIAIMESNMVIDTMEEQTRMSLQNFADTYMGQIEAQMANTQSLLYYFLTDTDFIKMNLETEKTYDYQRAKHKFFNSLKNMANMTNGVDGYFYYMKKIDDTIVYDSNPAESGQIYKQVSEFIKKQLNNQVKRGWHIYQINSQQYLFFIANTKDIAYGGWLNLDPLKIKLKKGLDYSDFSVSFSETKEDIIDNQLIMVSSSIKGIYLNISLNRTEILGGISVYQKILHTTAFLYLTLIPVLYVFLRFLLIRPLNKINNAHRQIQGGNQDFRITEKANSVEYQEAYQSFNQMADNLKTLRIKNYEKEIARQKMELRNLQLQIRPHFLLNMFNLIYAMAQRKEITAIQDIIIYLSDYFRYIFRYDKELDIFKNELKLIEGYVRIASIRYPGNIKMEFDFDPKIMQIRLPPLLIHNFIENSVKHGIKQGKILHISIIGKYENKMVTFYITDDGNGMDEAKQEKIRKLLSEEIEPDNPNSHIGLFNSIRRLKYFYGEEANIEITSQQGKMTWVKIQFPYNLEVDS